VVIVACKGFVPGKSSFGDDEQSACAPTNETNIDFMNERIGHLTLPPFRLFFSSA